MKNKNKGILLLIAFALGSCNYLDYDESTHYSKEQAYELFSRVKSNLTNIYSYVPISYGNVGSALRSAATDEAVFIQGTDAVHAFNDGTWSPTRAVDNAFHLYTPIRAVNLFLQEVEGETFEDLKYNQDYHLIMQQFGFYPYEARFLRAYYYFELAKRYGDIPLVTSVLTEDEANQLSRTPFDQVIEFIVDECDAIAPMLPINYDNVAETEYGRASRGMAMALKSKALLYAASPLFNPNNDKSKWEAAAKAAGDMIRMEAELGYTLPSLAGLTEGWSRNYPQNTELILGRLRGNENYFEAQNYPVGIDGGGATGHCPTQNLVEAYEMQATGLPVTATAGYETVDPAYDPNNPYVGRDPRLELTIAVNNSVWPTLYGQPLQIWQGGRSGAPVFHATTTGYYLKKYVVGTTEFRPGYQANSYRHVWMILRYSEILLNYAEAMIEAYGDYNYKTAELPISAKEAVDRVRSRAGVEMPPFPETLSPEEFKLKLRNERRVELAFEDQRFWDVRRWKILPETMDIYGVDITRNADESFTYTRVLVEKRVFSNRMYLYPIPESERSINANLTQNPDW